MTILVLVGIGYFAICALLFFCQDHLLFFPSRADEAELARAAEREGFEPWRRPDGTAIGWVSKSGDPGRALVVFHGNGGYALDRAYLASLPYPPGERPRVYLLEYPGYGARGGDPSSETFVAAAEEAIGELAAREPKPAIYLFGESIGSGVAGAVAGALPDAVHGVVLITPFNSLHAAAAHHHPWLPVGLILRHRFDPARELQGFGGPVAVVIAGRDEVIPAKLGRKLFEALPGPKRLWEVPGAGHNDAHLLLHEWPEIAGWIFSQGQ